tara:strand:- start:137 stop:301 length:165 start_codon:yes stop_codon:yes gene_type:complete
MSWYKTLSIEQRINLRIVCVDLCGVEFSALTKLLGLRMTIEAIHQKLKLEGFEV